MSTAFVWHDGVMEQLDDLIPPEIKANIHIHIACAINNAGQIVGMADALDNSGDQIAVRLTPIPPTPGDFNCDDLVNVEDLLGVIINWGADGGDGPADFNIDHTVDVDDLLVVLGNWS